MASHKQQQQAAPLQSSSSHDDLPKALELEFDAETGQISLTLFEHTDDKGAVPLTLLYKFSPETPYAPIHQVETPEVNKAVKQHCEWCRGRRRDCHCLLHVTFADWQLWGLDKGSDNLDTLSLEDKFDGETVEIKQDEVARFCRVVGNEQEAYKPTASTSSAPMEVPMDCE